LGNGNLAMASPYSDAVLANSPILYWRLDETTGTSAGNAGTGGNSLDGTYGFIPGNGTTNTSNYGLAGPRPISFGGFEATNNSVRFEPEDTAVAASTDFPRVDLASPADSALAFASALTLEAWVMRDTQAVAVGNNEGIIGRYIGSPAAQRSYILYYDSSATPSTDSTGGSASGGTGAVAFQVSSNGSNQAAQLLYSTANIPVGEWTHLAAVYDGVSATRTMSLYINGVLSGTITDGVAGKVVPASIYTGDSTFQIGQQFSGSNSFAFEGFIDEAAAYGSVLSGSNILAHYNAAIVPEPTSLAMAITGIVVFARVRRRSRR